MWPPITVSGITKKKKNTTSLDAQYVRGLLYSIPSHVESYNAIHKKREVNIYMLLNW